MLFHSPTIAARMNGLEFPLITHKLTQSVNEVQGIGISLERN